MSDVVVWCRVLIVCESVGSEDVRSHVGCVARRHCAHVLWPGERVQHS